MEILLGVLSLLSLVWEIPDSKSPPPAGCTCELGVDIRHSVRDSEIDIAELRVETLRGVVLNHTKWEI